ncbi:hypothetical protein RRF57_000803 [Xylaria bambusicola]|uniref:Uncharacterized protein n=1 Tax=Xylaria bambusicola TaxID=326684 RepID=A0AAN7Z113_9PEZI
MYWARSFVSALARLVRNIDRSSNANCKFPTAEMRECTRPTTDATSDVRENRAFNLGEEINGRCASLGSSGILPSTGNSSTVGKASKRKTVPSQNGRDSLMVMAAAAMAGLRKPTTEVKAVILLKYIALHSRGRC